MDFLKPFKVIKAFFKKITGLPIVRKILDMDLFMICAIVLLLVLVGLLVYLIRKRRKASAAQTKTEVAPEKNMLAPSSLLSVWKAYVKKIPWEFRRSILLYSPFVVLGESSSGKSALIDTYSDWKHQSNQFYPSYTDGADLQIFQGSDSIIQELSPAVLQNVTNHARIALVRLWKAFLKREKIIAVITIKSDELLADNKESVEAQAQVIRGKLNILSHIMKDPVTVHIAITFMDHVIGFMEFDAFSRKKAMSTHIDYNTEMGLSANASELYKKNLVNFLVSEPPQDYLKLLEFFNREADLYKGVEFFIDILLKTDPLTQTPQVEKIFFTSMKSQSSELSNPFTRPIPKKRFWQKHPYFKHQAAACILLLCGALYLGFSQSYEKHFLSHLRSDITQSQKNLALTDDKSKVVLRLLDKTKAISSNLLLSFLVRFQPRAEAEIQDNVISIVRKEMFLRRLGELKKDVNPYEEVRMLLALIYASNQNRLGQTILGNLDYWAMKTGFSKALISRYIELSNQSWGYAIQLKDVAYQRKIQRKSNQPLKVFMNTLKGVVSNEYLTHKQFASLQQDADLLFTDLSSAGFSARSDKLIPLLNQETVLELERYDDSREDTADVKIIKQFLYDFQKITYEVPDVASLNLDMFFNHLTAMSSFGTETFPQKSLDIDGTPVEFSLSSFYRVVKQSSIVSFVRKYISYYSYYGGTSFFNSDRDYGDLNVALSTEDKFFFTTKKRIDGRYTRKVYDEEIKPVLLKIPEIMKKLPVGKEEKNILSGFVYREAEAYSENYVSEYKKYYAQFRMKAESIGELRFMIKQILLPMSQFQEFMMILKDNLDLNYGDNAYFNPIMRNLGSMGFIKIIMEDQKGFFPELENYKAILRMVLEDLENGMAAAPEPKLTDNVEDTDGLVQLLSPSARMTLTILRNDRESYLKLMQKWEKSVGIPENLGYTFIEPIYQLYHLSLPEVSAQISAVWKELKSKYIAPYEDTFPFNENASKNADPVKIINLLNSQGEFWKNYTRYIAPVCRKKNGLWTERDFSMGSVSLPDDLLVTVNALESLGKLMINDKGEPRPLVVHIKAEPLPKIEKNAYIVILTYLQSGTSSVLGFNQKSSWKQFKINWWEENQSSVGVEYTDGENSDFKIYRNTAVPNSFWSFYRLLKKATPNANDNSWVWAVDSPNQIKWKRSVKFHIRENPFAIFKDNQL